MTMKSVHTVVGIETTACAGVKTMNLTEAKSIATDELAKHGLVGWTFHFDQAKKRFGLCKYHTKTISMSARLTTLNQEPAFRDTLLHEIAHAIIGPGHAHGSVWQNKALSIGCNGKRAYSKDDVITPAGKHIYVCPGCKREVPYHRRRTVKVACGICCKQHNHGKYSSEFILVPKEDAS